MPYKNHESQIALALRAMQNDPKLSARAAGEIDFVDHQKLIQPRRNILANSRKLSDLEELCLFISISLIWLLKDFRPECLLWKVWQIDSSRSVSRQTSHTVPMRSLYSFALTRRPPDLMLFTTRRWATDRLQGPKDEHSRDMFQGGAR